MHRRKPLRLLGDRRGGRHAGLYADRRGDSAADAQEVRFLIVIALDTRVLLRILSSDDPKQLPTPFTFDRDLHKSDDFTLVSGR